MHTLPLRPSTGKQAPLVLQVLGQIALAQALAPLLKPEPSSSYTVVTGRLGALH